MPEHSLDFLFYNTNKRSITLDLETEVGAKTAPPPGRRRRRDY